MKTLLGEYEEAIKLQQLYLNTCTDAEREPDQVRDRVPFIYRIMCSCTTCLSLFSMYSLMCPISNTFRKEKLLDGDDLRVRMRLSVILVSRSTNWNSC